MKAITRLVHNCNVFRRDWRSGSDKARAESLCVIVNYDQKFEPRADVHSCIETILAYNLNNAFIVAHDDPKLDLVTALADAGAYKIMVMDNADLQWVAKELYDLAATVVGSNVTIKSVRVRTANGLRVDYVPGAVA